MDPFPARGNKFVMRSDYKQVPAASSRGRMSNRITSKKHYGDSIMVLDLNHMPEGQGTWPAFWTFSQSQQYPAGGEIVSFYCYAWSFGSIG
jgi:hypothetical protein